MILGYQFDSWHASIVKEIEEYDEDSKKWKPAPAIAKLENHGGMKELNLADPDKIDLIFKNYSRDQESKKSKTTGGRRSGSFFKKMQDIPEIQIREAVLFSQKISQTKVGKRFSKFLYHIRQQFSEILLAFLIS